MTVTKDNVIKILEALKSNKVYGKNVEETVVIHVENEFIKDIKWAEIKNILLKLRKINIIDIESLPYTPTLMSSGVDPEKDKSHKYYKIKLLKGFDDHLQKYLGVTHKNESQVCLWISYPDNTREVLLNDIIIISKPNFNSINDLVFTYLYNNPNKTITKKALEREVNIKPITKRLHDIVQELGFKKELAKIFFSVSKTQITFRNPITKQDLIDLGHPKYRIQFFTPLLVGSCGKCVVENDNPVITSYLFGMKDLQSDKIRHLLRVKSSNSYSDSDYIESENNLIGLLETLVEIARGNQELIDGFNQKEIIHERE